jgi:hypothetical protein
MTDREKKIAEIRKSVEEARKTKGSWVDGQDYAYDVKFLLDELDRLRAERDSHGPEGRNYTNMQYVDLLMERDKMIEWLRMCLFNHGCWREEDYVAYMRNLLKEIGVTVEWAEPK